MKRLLATFLLLGFVLWILPLGFFIKPSQEKAACDGQRAMCMCHVFIPKSVEKAMEPGLWFNATPLSNKENNSSSNYFLSSNKVIHRPPSNILPLLNDPFSSYQNPYLASIDYVPKF